MCFTWWIKVGAKPSLAFGQTSGNNPDRSLHLLFRKAVYFVVLSKYWLVLVIISSSSHSEAILISLSGAGRCSGLCTFQFTISLKCGCTSALIYINIMCNKLFKKNLIQWVGCLCNQLEIVLKCCFSKCGDAAEAVSETPFGNEPSG